MSITKDNYKNKSIKLLKDEFGYKNEMQVPRLSKVCLNVSFKTEDIDNSYLSYVLESLSRIAGQKAVFVKAKKSISSFKLRQGMNIASIVTLRGDKMYEFLDRLIYIALPRIKDFRGLNLNSFNQSGHYSFGIKEHTIFPEVELDKVYKIFGMNINVVTTAKNKEECKSLLSSLLFPIK